VRIVSFLPAATEMAFALGLGDEIVGVSHECDFPAAARTKPVVVHNAVSLAALAPREIDSTVARALHESGTLYAVDEELLRALEPDLILTQDLCQVCAPSGNDITRLLGSLPSRPDVLYLTPRVLADVGENLRAIGRATRRSAQAEALIESAHERLNRVAVAIDAIDHRPRVFFAEWTDPLYCAGHWVPEMIERAGGIALLARPGGNSVRVTRQEAIASRPDVVIVAPCGFSLDGAVEQASLVGVPAERIFAVDANSFFARPGPRLVDGVELLAQLLHGDVARVTSASRPESTIEFARGLHPRCDRPAG
jgi:iron complex transport system substrate-binding protein